MRHSHSYTHLIRADAFKGLGTGHIMRCLALAQELLFRGDNVVFMTHCDFSALVTRLENEGCDVIRLAGHYPDTEDMEAVKAFYHDCRKPGAAIIDGYHFDRNYHLALRGLGLKTLAIDDHHHLDAYAPDLLLNQNIGAENIDYDLPEQQLLRGPKYVLIRREFLKSMPSERTLGRCVRVLVTMGGEDLGNVTLKALQALDAAAPDASVKVLAGAANPHLHSLESEIRSSSMDIKLLRAVEDMSQLLEWADLCISAGGSSCWELCLYGIPAVLVATADNQLGIVQGLDEYGAAVYAGWHEDVSRQDLAGECARVLGDRDLRIRMSRQGQKLIDGKGAARVADQLFDKLLS